MSRPASLATYDAATRQPDLTLPEGAKALSLPDRSQREWLLLHHTRGVPPKALAEPENVRVRQRFDELLAEVAGGAAKADARAIALFFGAPRQLNAAGARQWLFDEVTRYRLAIGRVKPPKLRGRPISKGTYVPPPMYGPEDRARLFKSDALLDQLAGVVPATYSAYSAAPVGLATPGFAGGTVDATTDAVDPDAGSPEPWSFAPQAGDLINTLTGSNAAGAVTPTVAQTCTGGEPVSLVTGEELLTLTDFVFSGPLPLAWVRTYRSANSGVATELGFGWSHPLCERLSLDGEQALYHDAEGRRIPLPLPALGGCGHNRAEGLSLRRLGPDHFALAATAPGGIERHFRDIAGELRLSDLIDAAGNRLHLDYRETENGARLDRLVSSWGDALRFTCDAAGHLSAIHREGEGGERLLHQYAIDNSGDLVSATDASGERERYAYTDHVITRRTIKSGYRYHFEWDHHTPAGRCLRQWGDAIDGQPTYDYRFHYEAEARTTTVTDTRGGEQTYRFNERAQVLWQRDAEGAEQHYTYADDGRLLAHTDAEGHTETFAYDDTGRLLLHRDRSGAEHRYNYDDAGRAIAYTDPLGHTWRRAYNRRGLLSAISDPLGNTTHLRYNPLGLPGAIIDAAGHTTHYLWDERGRLSAVRDPLGRTATYRYDSHGQLAGVGALQCERDDSGRLIALHTPDGSHRYDYTAHGQLAAHTDPLGRTTRYTYDGLSQVRSRCDAAGTTLHYHYDGERNLVGLTNEKGEHYRLAYDRNERLIEECGFDGRTQRYRYDRNGHLLERHAIGSGGAVLQTIRYQRDPLGRTLRIDRDDGTTHFRFDRRGQPLHAANAHRELRWAWDPAGRLTEEWQDDQRLAHRYDAAGRRTGSELPDGAAIGYTFDALGQLLGLSHNGDPLLRIKRDERGREMARRFGNALETAALFDPLGRLLAQKTVQRPRPGSADFVSQLIGDLFGDKPPVERELTQQLYRYDSGGRLTRIEDQQRGTTRYRYDALDRLIQVEGPLPETLVHDPAHNLLGASPDAADAEAQAATASLSGNRLLARGDTLFAYDDHGNRTETLQGEAHTRYEYNSEQQLIAVETAAGRTTYRYDPLGRRIEKANRAGRTTFLWNGDQLLAETHYPGDAANNASTTSPSTVSDQAGTDPATRAPTTRLYLFEPGSFRPLALIEAGRRYYYHLDHLGTPQALSDDTGATVWAASFHSYGQFAIAHVAQLPQPLRFQGQYADEETGLHYNRFRYYDPTTGRFINQDPIGLLGGLNNYQYVPNPIGWVDPLGLSCKEGGGWMGAVAGALMAAVGLGGNAPSGDPSFGKALADPEFWSLYADGVKSVGLAAGKMLLGEASVYSGWILSRVPGGQITGGYLMADGASLYAGGMSDVSNLFYGGSHDYDLVGKAYRQAGDYYLGNPAYGDVARSAVGLGSIFRANTIPVTTIVNSSDWGVSALTYTEVVPAFHTSNFTIRAADTVGVVQGIQGLDDAK